MERTPDAEKTLAAAGNSAVTGQGSASGDGLFKQRALAKTGNDEREVFQKFFRIPKVM